MKIVYYIDTVIPTKRANMVHVMKMCQAFSALGHKVTLRCDSAEKTVDVEQLQQQYAIDEKFDIQTAYIPYVLHKYGHRFSAYYGAWKKSRLALDHDYAYSRSAMSLFFVRNKISYIYEAHMEPDILNRVIEEKILRHHNCIKLVVISMALKKRYLEVFPFLSEDKIVVLHDAADVVFPTSTIPAVLESSEDVTIGYIGHLYPGKCMETLMPLAKACPQNRFHIIGGMEEWVTYWKKRADTEEISNLIFYGYVSNTDVGNYYQAVDVMLLPFSGTIHIGTKSKTDIGKWISPLKLFEAMSYGKAILVSRLPTIEEVMTDGKDCIMVNPDDIDDWKEKLCKVCADKELRKRIGIEAQKKLEEQYTWKKRAQSVIQILSEPK